MPKVSVIIPNYNHARFLGKRIQSVLDQTYQDFELIILDDASPDNSKQVIEKFLGDQRIRTIYNQTNSGSTFKQWNKGIREAKGEYIWIAESDDYADERLLAQLVAKLEQYPDVGIAYSQSWRIDEHDNILCSMTDWTADLDETRWQQDFVNNGIDECSHYLVIKNTIINASAIVFKRSVYETVGGPNESMRYCGDWLLWTKMLLISDIAFAAEPLNYYRTHQKTVTSNTYKNAINTEENYLVLKELLNTISISKEVLNKACEEMARQWVNTLVTQRGRISLERNKKIYEIAHIVDPKLRQRLARKISFRVFDAIKRRIISRSLVG